MKNGSITRALWLKVFCLGNLNCNTEIDHSSHTEDKDKVKKNIRNASFNCSISYFNS